MLHPDAIAPAVRAGIEVRVRYVEDPTHPGTILTEEEEVEGPVAAVVTVQSSRSAVALVGARSGEFEVEARRALEEARLLGVITTRGFR